ncbi:GIY-YIG nuclease family protein [Candidatus Peregrinibacteria bacterium]|nr:GIY-YIG nuclease family protein [Candidatus Peregrinibacteria bacterium]
MRHRISSYARLQRRIAKTPITPGIYRWLDKEGKTIYIGKAKNLRRRLTSYFQKNKANQGPWKRALMTNSADFDITVTQSDLEALILETNLIKEYRPKYNVLMKDDKNYLFIRISVEDPYPRVETVRKLEKDGAKYFGPYLSSAEVRKTLDMLQETLQYRACKQSLDRLNRHPGTSLASDVPCLEYQIGRCNGLCNGAVDSKTYLQRIEALMNFLKGNRGPVREIVKERMQRAALERKFELAAKPRNYLLTFAQKPQSSSNFYRSSMTKAGKSHPSSCYQQQ